MYRVYVANKVTNLRRDSVVERVLPVFSTLLQYRTDGTGRFVQHPGLQAVQICTDTDGVEQGAYISVFCFLLD